MEIITIIISVLGAFGGVGGFIALYNAKANKTSLEISNFHQLIEEERAQRESLKAEYESYRQIVNSKVDDIKQEVMQMREQNYKMTASIYSAFRCAYLEKVEDCIVYSNYHKLGCAGCTNNLSSMDFIVPEIDKEEENEA
jgi:hypothetical protein